MTRWMLSLTVFWVLTSAVVADDQTPRLDKPAPRVSLARMADDGNIEFLDITYCTETRMVPGTAVKPDGTVRKTVLAERTAIVRRLCTRVNPENAPAFDVHGKEIPTKDLAILLRAQKPVLVSADGQPVDSSYLQLAKDDTLIFVSPGLLAPDPAELPAKGGWLPVPLPDRQP
jgi:hypothetical protein